MLYNHLYYHHIIDSSFGIWSGCYASPADRMATMACIALAGYHSRATYRWLRNDSPIGEGDTPLLYEDREGTYECQVAGDSFFASRKFIVTRKLRESGRILVKM